MSRPAKSDSSQCWGHHSHFFEIDQTIQTSFVAFMIIDIKKVEIIGIEIIGTLVYFTQSTLPK